MQPTEKVYPRLTVDPVVLTVQDGVLQVLLYKRNTDPYRGVLAIPGGDFYANELAVDAVKRALDTKAGFDFNDISHTEQLYFFDTKGLDVRGHAVSLAYLCTLRPKQKKAQALFMDINQLPMLAYDHISIVHKAIEVLRQKLLTTTYAQFLLPKQFSLNDLHRLYCAVFSTDFDNRNFRKKFLSFAVLTDTNAVEKGVSYRPGKLYSFTGPTIINLAELTL